jgi:hypothetical protein
MMYVADGTFFAARARRLQLGRPLSLDGLIDRLLLRMSPFAAQLRHGRLKTFAAQKHCSFLR